VSRVNYGGYSDTTCYVASWSSPDPGTSVVSCVVSNHTAGDYKVVIVFHFEVASGRLFPPTQATRVPGWKPPIPPGLAARGTTCAGAASIRAMAAPCWTLPSNTQANALTTNPRPLARGR